MIYKFEELFLAEEEKYLEQARWLHEKGLHLELSEYELAKILYEKLIDEMG